MSGNEAFELVKEQGWRRGMGNMLKNEMDRWWKTKRWWISLLMWVVITAFIMSSTLFSKEQNAFDNTLIIFGIFVGVIPSIAVIITMQDVLVGEKHDGTAAWVLSKPVARPAFILPKLIGNGIGVLVTMVGAPVVAGYVLLSMFRGIPLDPLPFLAVMGVFFVSQFFFLTLTLMLGSLLNNRGAVIGIALAVLLAQQLIVPALPPLGYLLPWNLVATLGSTPDSLAYALLKGLPVQPVHLITLGLVIFEGIVFILICLWRFEKEEL
jgi:ABC-type transport system involved in multi-copper enzyme maturation permease subunit